MNLRSAVSCALVAALSAPAAAATIGPDTFGYVASDPSSSFHTFVDISGTGTPALAGENNGGTTLDLNSLGFSFTFYGTQYDTVHWSPDGFVSFGQLDVDHADNLDLSIVETRKNLPSISIFWDQLTFAETGADQTYWELFGSPGSQQLVIQWNDVFHVGNFTDGATFELVLYEGTNWILFHYADVAFGDSSVDGGASATVGIRDVGAPQNGRHLLWSFNDASLSDDQVILFVLTPEPGTLALYGLGVAGLAAGIVVRRRRRRAATA